MNLKERKLMDLPAEILAKFDTVPKDDDFRILSNADTRKFAKAPKNLPTTS